MNLNSSSQNITSPFIRWQHWNWIVPEVVNSIFILLTIWIFFSLIHYGNKSKKWATRANKNFEKLNAGFVLMAAVFCAVTALFRFIVSQVALNLTHSYNENSKCKMISNVLVVAYCLATFSVYVYLWVRQSVFYTNRMLSTNFSKSLRFFSYLSIVLIFLGGLGAIFFNTLPSNYHSTPVGCAYIPEDSTLTATMVIVSTMVTVLGQIILVGLVVYPLLKHSNERGCLAMCGLSNCYKRNQQSEFSQKKNKIHHHHAQSNKKIHKILRKTVIFSIIIVISDIIFLVVTTYALTGQNNRRISTMLYDIATFANLLFVVSSIGHWKNILRMSPPVHSTSFSLNTPQASQR